MAIEQAFTPNNINKTDLIKTFRYSIREYVDEFLYYDKPKVMWAKGELSVIYGSGQYWLCSTKQPLPIGVLSLAENSYRTTVDYSFILPAYQGKGLGFLMYEIALKDNKELYSSDDLSKGSSALWQKLVTKYKGELVLPREDTHMKNFITVKIAGWRKRKGITYPMFNTAKGPKDLSQLFKLFDKDSQKAAGEAYYKIRSK